MEALFPLGRPVNERVEKDEIAGSEVFTEATTCRSRQNMGYSQFLHCTNVGSIVDLGRVEPMTLTMPEGEMIFQ